MVSLCFSKMLSLYKQFSFHMTVTAYGLLFNGPSRATLLKYIVYIYKLKKLYTVYIFL